MYRQFRFCERDFEQCPLRSEIDQIAASPRNDEMGQNQPFWLRHELPADTTRKNLKANKKAGRDGPAFCLGRMSRSNQDNACLTRSGENGTRRMRTPVASKIALAIAAATGRIGGSPAPVGGSSG